MAFIILFLIFVSQNIIYGFKCGTDQLKLKYKVLNITKTGDKRRLDKEFTPIQIGIDYTSFIKPNSMSNANFNKAKYLLNETIKEFQKFLKIQHEDIDLSGKLNEIKEYCELDEVGSNYANFLKVYDVIIFPSFDNTLGSSVLAASKFCLLADNNRPIAGVLYINSSLSFDKRNTDIYMKDLLLHEMTHILIFHPTLLRRLNMITTKNFVSYVSTKNVVEKAREHFNCTSITGVALENQGSLGSVGSHWEARYMLGDYMISQDYIDIVLSDITIAMFKDSGFYDVNYYSGGLFKYGKNKGCDFLNKKCIVDSEPLFEDEFCISPREPMCSSSKTMKGFCAIYEYTSSIPFTYQYFTNPKYGGFYPANYCPVANSDFSDVDYFPSSCKIGTSTLSSDYGEIIGNNSFCFISSLLPSNSKYNSISQAICYKVECDNTNKNIIVHIGSSKINCPTSGGNITNPSGFKGTIRCPKFIDICDFEGNIMCNEMFDCLNRNENKEKDYSQQYVNEDDNVDENINDNENDDENINDNKNDESINNNENDESINNNENDDENENDNENNDENENDNENDDENDNENDDENDEDLIQYFSPNSSKTKIKLNYYIFSFFIYLLF